MSLNQASGPTSGLRRDALRSRAAILRAARELFTSTDDVSMDEVAHSSGVDRATLDRHFPDRPTLAAALVEEIVDGLELVPLRRTDDPNALAELLRTICDTLLPRRGLLELIQTATEEQPRLLRSRNRLLGLFDDPLRAAHAAGRVRADLDATDLARLLAMLTGGLIGITDSAARATAARRMLELTLHGILSPGGGPGSRPAPGPGAAPRRDSGLPTRFPTR
jgi:AcrR family transcriptional regulator